MKRLLLMSILILTQISFAGPVETKRMMERYETVKARVESDRLMEEIKDLKLHGKNLLEEPILRGRLRTAVERAVDGALPKSSLQVLQLLSLVEMNPNLFMTEIAFHSSIAKDPLASVTEKAQARRTLELISLAGNRLGMGLTISEISKQMMNFQIDQMIKVSRDLAQASLDPKNKEAIESYERALTEGSTVIEALRNLKSAPEDIKKIATKQLSQSSSFFRAQVKKLEVSLIEFMTMSPSQQVQLVQDYGQLVQAMEITKFSPAGVPPQSLVMPIDQLSQYLIIPNLDYTVVKTALTNMIVKYSRLLKDPKLNGYATQVVNKRLTVLKDNTNIDPATRHRFVIELYGSH